MTNLFSKESWETLEGTRKEMLARGHKVEPLDYGDYTTLSMRVHLEGGIRSVYEEMAKKYFLE
jgi:hypothetical protein